ncbi:hypothetical protein PF010_g29519 [Phytophthora fragariae]|uniref:Uncharacterized protein n=1 Tax=Phytophthora fragariae TaxID=53985 RepID=A0A6G0JNS7_9STRA|nr:hypothetical protein PF010_g29519 [Phytophthora fragariae]
MELLQAIQNDVLKQKEEEAVNQFFTSAGFREFILTTHPNPDVMREVFEQTLSGINDLTPLKRKPYLVQVTVWDTKQKKGCYGKAIIDFKPGAYERGNDFKIFETEPPLKKRKLPSEISPVSANAKTHASVATPGMSGANAGDGDVVMTSGSKGDGNHASVTTRNKRHP